MMRGRHIRGRVRRAFARWAGLIGLALTLAALSSYVEHEGPAQVAYGNLCGPAGDEACNEPELSGGYPLAFLFDAPGVSVERQLSFIDDRFLAWAFGADVVLNAAALWALVRLGRRLKACARA